MIKLRELKARKAKYGFHYGKIHLKDVIDLGQFLTCLQTNFSDNLYILEEAGYNQPELKIYTDDEEVANWLRQYIHKY
jgi:hypothetical protein